MNHKEWDQGFLLTSKEYIYIYIYMRAHTHTKLVTRAFARAMKLFFIFYFGLSEIMFKSEMIFFFFFWV